VTVTSKQVAELTPFRVMFVTQSKDDVFDKLKDAWPYTATVPAKAN